MYTSALPEGKNLVSFKRDKNVWLKKPGHLHPSICLVNLKKLKSTLEIEGITGEFTVYRPYQASLR